MVFRVYLQFRRTYWPDYRLAVVVLITDVPRFILPPPALVYTAFVENWRLIAEHGLVTFTEVMLGLMLVFYWV